MKTFVRFGLKKIILYTLWGTKSWGLINALFHLQTKKLPKRSFWQWMRKTFHALSPLHFLMGKCTAGVKCSLDITSKNIVSSKERKSMESAKDLLKTNVLGPWLHQDNRKELWSQSILGGEIHCAPAVWRCAVELRAANDRLARCQLKQFRASIQPN